MTGLLLNLVGLGLALGVPVLIAMWAPQRWRVAGMLAWLLLPLILAIVLAVIQAAQGPAPGDLGKLLFGFAIIGSVLAIPWLLACAAGFAIGTVLRSKSSAPAQPAAGEATPAAVQAAVHESVPAAPAIPHSVEEIDPYLSRHIAPDGSILVELSAVEWGNTHWVNSPKVIESAGGRVLLDLWGTDWDAVVSFPAARTVALSFRRYHHGGALDAEIHLDGADFAGGFYVIRERSGGTGQGPLAEMPAALEAASKRAAAVARSAAIAQPAPSAGRGQYKVALLILAGAIVAIGAATVVVHNLTPVPVQKLDKIPPMPT